MEYYAYKLSDDELQHWGIRGMKWGVRRYQNKDGSLTAAGKKKYKAELEKVKKAEADLKRRQATKAKLDKLNARKQAVKKGNDDLDASEGKQKRGLFKRDKKSGKKDEKKSIKDMTDEELNAAVNRSRLEQQYKQLNPDPVPKKSRLVNEMLIPAAINGGKKFIEGLFDKATKNMLGEAKNAIDYDKEIKKLNYENTKKRNQAHDEGYSSWYARQEAKKKEETSAKKSSFSPTMKVTEVPFKTTTAGKTYVNKVKSNSLANDPDWQAFKKKYSWGVEDWAMDEVVD